MSIQPRPQRGDFRQLCSVKEELNPATYSPLEERRNGWICSLKSHRTF